MSKGKRHPAPHSYTPENHPYVPIDGPDGAVTAVPRDRTIEQQTEIDRRAAEKQILEDLARAGLLVLDQYGNVTDTPEGRDTDAPGYPSQV